MGYAHGTKWSDELIEVKIKEVMEDLGLSTMPTRSMIARTTGSGALNNAISRKGGFIVWADNLGIKHKGIQTAMGRELEERCMRFIQDEYGFNVKLMKQKYPYDLLVNDNIKIDVKSGKMYKGEFAMYTFNLEKRFPTCDIFVAYCLTENREILKTYVIPSKILSGKTQLSVGVHASKYDEYLDNWGCLEVYEDFYKSIKKQA